MQLQHELATSEAGRASRAEAEAAIDKAAQAGRADAHTAVVAECTAAVERLRAEFEVEAAAARQTAELQLRELEVVAASQVEAARVRGPTAWTIFQHDGPNHLGL